MKEIYLDYDDILEHSVVEDIRLLCQVLEVCRWHARIELYFSSPSSVGKNNYHVKIILPYHKPFYFCLGLMLLSHCDDGYKKLVLDRGEFTIRVSHEVSREGIKPKPEFINRWYV